MVSAWKLKCPSSARNLHSSARAGKFQLGLVTRLPILIDLILQNSEQFFRFRTLRGFNFLSISKEFKIWLLLSINLCRKKHQGLRFDNCKPHKVNSVQDFKFTLAIQSRIKIWPIIFYPGFKIHCLCPWACLLRCLFELVQL